MTQVEDEHNNSFYHIRVKLQQPRTAIIHLGLSAQEIEKDLVPFRRSMLLTGGFLVFIVPFVFGYFLSRSISKPVLMLSRGAQKIGNGELNYRVYIETGDEIQELADGLNHMAARLLESYSSLEQKVLERTESLRNEIDTRKHIEAALREEKDKAQKYLDIAGVMFIALDAEGKVILSNKKAIEVLGYEEMEIMGKNWIDNFLPERVREKVKAVFKKIMAGEINPVECYEIPILTRDGQERVIKWQNTVLKDEEGKIAGSLSSGNDVTERKQAERDRVQRERLQGVLEMAGAVCHELNQPLQIVSTYSELLMAGMTDDSPLQGNIKKIKAQIDRMGEVNRKLIRITKYETMDYLFEGEKIIDIDKASGNHK